MLLQIIVPHYKERAEEVEPLLDSLKLQQAVDFAEFEVLIVYDGDEAWRLPIVDWARKYPFKIRHIHKPHGGISHTRNHGLDLAEAEYVMFCDADDMFCHVCGLRMVFDEIYKGFDTLTSAFIEETKNPDTGAPLFVVHAQDATFVHGKVHRLAFLRENNIRFCDRLLVHEDSYFHTLVNCCVTEPERGRYLPEKFYLWKWRDNSICRHDPDYILKTYPAVLESSDAAVDELMRRGLDEYANIYAGMMLIESYYTLNRKEWLEVTHKDYRDATERRIAEYYHKHKARYEAMTDAERMKASAIARERAINNGMLMESISFPEWLRHIDAL